MNKFAVFDIDGTLIRWQLYHAVVNKLAKEGVLGEDAHKTLKSAMMIWKRREHDDSYKDYEYKLIKVYENALLNLNTKIFDKLVLEVIDEYKDQTYVYSRNLLKQLKKQSYKLFIISGSHTELIKHIAEYYGFDDFIGSIYERDGQSFTGKNTHLPSLNKAGSLDLLIKRNSVTTEGSIGIGDTYSDAPILSKVDNPIAFNPERRLYKHAKKQGWKIVVERKNVVYELVKSNEQYTLT
jgi:HAD superfamily hydrolase (TIGR01490 family)